MILLRKRPRVYYNEFDPAAAAWLRELIRRDLIAPGEVDERSVTDVHPSDLAGYTQCHFFAGIGGWSYALRLAGWPDDRPVWTGSCPCQPFSDASENKIGFEDPRHLWPTLFKLVRECQPTTVFGEQVASADGVAWSDGVRSDLEGADYAFGAFDLVAQGVGAPHVRKRLYFVADSNRYRRESREHTIPLGSETEDLPVQTPKDRGHRDRGIWSSTREIRGDSGKRYLVQSEPGFTPLAHGVPAGVGRLRGYGNAIVPQLAAQVIRAYMEYAA